MQPISGILAQRTHENTVEMKDDYTHFMDKVANIQFLQWLTSWMPIEHLCNMLQPRNIYACCNIMVRTTRRRLKQ